eukprot:CAMPEP_0178953464 /NCGR_PEP_ID=MMETSP0789-20121207/8434_1 /TAXON_ID=3005 /ORGANISM="Rhizosolenia setigera, Strain CCMP 1694" /LENGTH=495 /DNA_ID=CAMNT_0020634727 /DNA_START=87 /DNA_END=1574 /DNA_ORIENTATION=+
MNSTFDCSMAPEVPTTVEELTCYVDSSVGALATSVDGFYLLWAGATVFLMQAGFAMLCAGSIRSKNVKNIMLKNLLDACAGALGFWSIGYALAYGGSDGTYTRFNGDQNFFLRGFETGGDYIGWFFQFAFAATAATIVAGTVAERCKMSAYLCYSLFLTGVVYPIVVHAIWATSGFISAFNPNPFLGVGMVDFAGSGVVHMTGGFTALVAAAILGPRKGRFYDEDGNALEEPVSFPPHSVALQVLGTFILWFGWYGFNPGSTLMASGSEDVAALCAVNTTLSAAAGCVTALFVDSILGKMASGEAEYDLSMAMNGALGGLVGITAGCSVCTPGMSVIIGIISGLVYKFSSALLVKLKIDDAVDAVPVHFFCGMWGCVAVGLFADPAKMDTAGYNSDLCGAFFGGGGTLLGVEICGILFIIGWISVIMIPFFYGLKVAGLFRVDPLEEDVGLDISHHKGSAYDISGPKQEDVDELMVRRSQHGKSGVSSPEPSAEA